MIIYKAGETLFMIHASIRELSPVMAEVFANERFTCDEYPRIQTNATAAEFEALLDMLYTPAYAAKDLSQPTYALALPLCIKWQLRDIQTFIVSELKKTMGAVELLSLAQEHNISDLAECSLRTLVTQSERLTVEEGRKLGFESVMFISGLREEMLARNMCSHGCVACDSKRHGEGKSTDLEFMESKVKEWVNSKR
ncbi:hypothetical protein BDV93DRAFT_244738 [Ceratobasidium sp. AG-I]|nr:hypothetical protein BDV93DRAFT_244738 [Ceratobasidium sp. AG-I]